MKVYLEPPHPSMALRRIADALVRHAPPGIETVARPSQADLVILQVIGRRQKVAAVCEQTRARGARYALLQWCLRSTQQPDTNDWVALWRRASVVWSTYDLSSLAAEDGTSLEGVSWIHQPIGVDGSFRPDIPRGPAMFTVLTSGPGWLSESVRETAYAAYSLGLRVAHLGPRVGPAWIETFEHVPDTVLAGLYAQCAWVSGLRRTEGFELPAAEGLVCGARPILFDRPHYRRWYGTWADYIEERPRADVIDQLRELFSQPVRPVTRGERRAAALAFQWGPLARRFWEACR